MGYLKLRLLARCTNRLPVDQARFGGTLSFDPVELETINAFQRQMLERRAWPDTSELGFLVPAAPSTKGRFARSLIEALAAEAAISHQRVQGNRCRVGDAVCEIKFSMESPGRFQQVRPPEDNYDYLLCIAAQHDRLRYWLIPAADVAMLIDEELIAFQHADTSRWFRAELIQDDAFSPYRCEKGELVEKLAALA